jgi:DNA polymerase-3 subunit alpha
VVEGDIRFGLTAIKNVGQSAIAGVVQARRDRGPFTSIYDFCSRVDLRLVNKKCLESLVQAGAFDSISPDRSRHFESVERASLFGASVQESAQNGQSGLFDDGGPQPRAVITPTLAEANAWTESEKLQKEKAVLGFYVSGHPLLRYEQEVNEFANVHFGDLGGFRDGATVRACGVVAAVRKKVDKRNNTMAFVMLEDFSGKAECIVFSDPYTKYAPLLQPDAMVMVTGKGELTGESLRILVNEVYPMEKVREKFTKSVIISINLAEAREGSILQLRELLEKNKGTCPCYISVTRDNGRTMYHAPRYAVEPSDEFVLQTRRIFGPQGVRFSS